MSRSIIDILESAWRNHTELRCEQDKPSHKAIFIEGAYVALANIRLDLKDHFDSQSEQVAKAARDEWYKAKEKI